MSLRELIDRPGGPPYRPGAASVAQLNQLANKVEALTIRVEELAERVAELAEWNLAQQNLIKALVDQQSRTWNLLEGHQELLALIDTRLTAAQLGPLN